MAILIDSESSSQSDADRCWRYTAQERMVLEEASWDGTARFLSYLAAAALTSCRNMLTSPTGDWAGRACIAVLGPI